MTCPYCRSTPCSCLPDPVLTIEEHEQESPWFWLACAVAVMVGIALGAWTIEALF